MAEKSTRKRTLSETIPDSSSHEPPKKKQKTSIPSALKNPKQLNTETLTIYYQIADYTQQQISNILSNTTKGVNRPILLFSDNDIDNFWIRLNRTKHQKHSNNIRQQIYDTEHNAVLIARYDNYNNSDFLSFGIITNYIAKQSVTSNWNEFKANIDGAFEIIFELIKKKKIKHIIIPSKYPLSKTNKNEIFHRLNYGSNLKHHHLLYIQSKINELEKTFATNYVFIDEPVHFDQKSPFNCHNIITECNKQRKVDELLKNRKTVTFEDIEHPQKSIKTENEEKECRLEQEVQKRKKQKETAKKIIKQKKPPLFLQATLEIEDETDNGPPSPSPSSMGTSTTSKRTYQRFPKYDEYPLDLKQRDQMLSMTQYEPISMTYQQYQTYQESKVKQKEIDNLVALRTWEHNKLNEYKHLQRIQQSTIAREYRSGYMSASPSIEISTSLPPIRDLNAYKTEGNIVMWQNIIKIVMFVVVVWIIWSIFQFIPDPTFNNKEESMGNQVSFVWLWLALFVLIVMVVMGMIFGERTHKSPLFWISWLMFVVICYRAIKDIMDYNGHLPADRYQIKHNIRNVYLYDDDDDDYYYNNPYYNTYDPVSEPVSEPIKIETQKSDIKAETPIYRKSTEDIDDKMGSYCDTDNKFGGLWMQYGVDVLFWCGFGVILSLCLPHKKGSFIAVLTIGTMIVFCALRFMEKIISHNLNLCHSDVVNVFWCCIFYICMPCCIMLIFSVHITRCLNVSQILYNMKCGWIIKFTFVILMLFWMYYDRILAIQCLMISWIMYIVITNCISYIKGLKEHKKKRKKNKRRKRIYDDREHFDNPYAPKSYRKRKYKRRSYASYMELQRNRQSIDDIQFL